MLSTDNTYSNALYRLIIYSFTYLLVYIEVIRCFRSHFSVGQITRHSSVFQTRLKQCVTPEIANYTLV